MNKQDKQKLINTDNSMVVTRRGWGRWTRVNGVKYMVTGGDQTLGSERTMRHTDDVLWNSTLETYTV